MQLDNESSSLISGCGLRLKDVNAGEISSVAVILEPYRSGVAANTSVPDYCTSSSAGSDRKVFESGVLESINSLRHEVGELRSELRTLKSAGVASSPAASVSKSCCLYLRVQAEWESGVGCPG